MLLKWLLSPLTILYRGGLWFHQNWQLNDQKILPRPVISVGNLSLGGTGKTAFVQWLLKNLKEAGVRPAVLKRGEGILAPGVLVEENQNYSVRQFGDEVALLRKNFPAVPVGVGKNRYQSGKDLLKQTEVDLFLLDDGFQHLTLARDLDIVLLDNNDIKSALLPSGPLREPLSALSRADYISLKQSEPPSGNFELISPATVLNHYYQFSGIWRGEEEVTEMMRGKMVHLVTTLARPNALVDFLENAGFEVREKLFLPDHSDLDLDLIQNELELDRVVMTEKELVKLAPENKTTVGCIRSRMVVDGGEELISACLNLTEDNLANDS